MKQKKLSMALLGASLLTIGAGKTSLSNIYSMFSSPSIMERESAAAILDLFARGHLKVDASTGFVSLRSSVLSILSAYGLVDVAQTNSALDIAAGSFGHGPGGRTT